MANHVAQQLIDGVAMLVTGLTTTGANVFKNRPADRQLKDTQLPALIVQMLGEEVQIETIGQPVYRRTQRFGIAVRVKQADTAYEVLNQIRKEVEIAMSGDVLIGTIPIAIDYTGLSDPESDAESELPIVSAALSFEALMYTTDSAPDVLL